MYYFKTEMKEEALNGRTVAFLLTIIDINYSYLSRILNGKIHCSLKTAKQITKAIDENANTEDFFIKKKYFSTR